MDLESEFFINPLSYILAAVSAIGFFIIVLNERKEWIQAQLTRKGSRNATVLSLRPDASPSGERPMMIAGLIFLGGLFSAMIFLVNETVERLNFDMTLFEFMLIQFAFLMLPGILAGISAGLWINAAHPGESRDLLASLITGLLAYLALVAVVGFTDIDPLLFLCGPAVTLLVYRFSEKSLA